MSNQENKNNRVSQLELNRILLENGFRTAMDNAKDFWDYFLKDLVVPKDAIDYALIAAGPIVKGGGKAVKVVTEHGDDILKLVSPIVKEIKSTKKSKKILKGPKFLKTTKADVVRSHNAKVDSKLMELQTDPNFSNMGYGVRVRKSDGYKTLIGPDGIIYVDKFGGKLSNNVAQVLKIRNNK